MYRGWVNGQAGRRRDAALVLDRLKKAARHRYVYPSVFLNLYLAVGNKEQAIAWLERAYEEQDPWLFWLKVHPMVDSLRGEPRFQAVLRRVYPE